MIEYKDYLIVITWPARQHPNATALMQVRKEGVTLKNIRYKCNYLKDRVDALAKAKSFIDKFYN